MELLKGMKHVEPMHVDNGCIDAKLAPKMKYQPHKMFELPIIYYYYWHITVMLQQSYALIT